MQGSDPIDSLTIMEPTSPKFMSSQHEYNYKPGEVVWVKIPQFPWWPAEVVDPKKEPLYDAGNVSTVAFVRFFHENNYGKIKKRNYICPFHSSLRQSFIDKGLICKTSPMFRSALAEADEVYKLRRMYPADKLTSSGSKSAETSVVTSTTVHNKENAGQKHNDSCENSRNENERFNCTVSNHDIPKKNCLTDNFTEQVDDKSRKRKRQPLGITSKRRKRAKLKMSAKIIRSSKVCKDLFKSKTKKTNFEKSKKDSSIVIGIVQPRTAKERVNIMVRDHTHTNTIRKINKPYYFNGSSFESDNKMDDCGNLSCRTSTYQTKNVLKSKFSKMAATNKQVRKNKSKKGRKKKKKKMVMDLQIDQTPTMKGFLNDRQLSSSLSDYSPYLPTPPLPGICPKELFDPNLDKDLCDSSSDDDDDMDLPVGLSPVLCTGNFPVAEKQIVWLKWRRYPYWPAYIKKIYTKKTRLLKVSYLFLAWGDQGKKHKGVCLSYKHGTIYAFNHERKEEFLKAGQLLDKEERIAFQEANRLACDFLNKKALGMLHADEWTFLSQQDSDIDETEDDQSNTQSSVDVQSLYGSSDTLSSLSFGSELIESENKLSKKGEARLQKLKAKAEELVAFVLSDKTKKYLSDIFFSRIESDRHMKFRYGTTRDRMGMKHSGFGPIGDDQQQEQIVSCLLEWLTECYRTANITNIPDVPYLLDVWIPEAVVFGITNVTTYCKSRAWVMFKKGVRMTNEEKLKLHDNLVTGMKRMSKTEKRAYYEKLQERALLYGLSSDLLPFADSSNGII